MTQEEFWGSLDAAATLFPDLDDRIRTIAEQLQAMSDEDLAHCRDHLHQALAALCTPEVYGAAVLLTGRTVDDERFEVFRTLLVLKGHRCWEMAQGNVDDLAGLAWSQQEKELDFAADMLLYAPHFAYQDRHGEEAELDEAFPPANLPEQVIETQFTREELEQRFPRLWAHRRAMVKPRVTEA